MARLNFSRVKRILFFGGSSLLVQCAKQAVSHGFETIIVVAPRHAGEPVNGQPFSRQIRGIGAQVILTDDAPRCARVLRLIDRYTLGISLGAPWVFTGSFIDRFQGRLLNIHGTRLPRNRGGGGFSWQIMQGDRRGACLIHQIDRHLDSGAIVCCSNFIYPVSCTRPIDRITYYIQKNAPFFDSFLRTIKKGGSCVLRRQAPAKSTYWPRLSSAHHAFIDWRWNARDIVSYIHAFDAPYTGAMTFLGDTKVHLRSAAAHRGDGPFHPFQAGIVYRRTAGRVWIAAPGGGVSVAGITDEKGGTILPMVRSGDRFITPVSVLENALRYRAHYTPKGLRAYPEDRAPDNTRNRK